ncbi:MAG: alpha/beta hydrolase [Gemmatimonadota bacterium]|nr:alpha/beta hydrolase [Gemmatimonadota bacterium]
MTERALAFTTPHGRVSGVLVRPHAAWVVYVLAHGAGAGMRHPFLEAVARVLAERGVATVRYQFPYMERASRRPDPASVAEAVVRAVVEEVQGTVDLPLLAGGKSFGGRMTSQAAAKAPLSAARGLVFLGFPLHAAGRASTTRAAHLRDVTVPMLFLQGTRDTLAEASLIRDVCRGLGEATLREIEGADHSFKVLKRSGRTDAEVREELGDTMAEWAHAIVGRRP